MLGVIGGTGLYDLPDLENVSTEDIDTPFGTPSASFVTGRLGDAELVFLSRHGHAHRLNPSELPYRANIYGMKQLGVTHLLSVNAVGSLQEYLPPRTAVVPDQVLDRTVGRSRTFFEGGIVGHVGLADPFCAAFRQEIVNHARSARQMVHDGGTYICIEGPQFSTRAESRLYRQWGADIIGMTAMPEARLAREAGLCYGSIAMVTDYDVWHETEDDVTLDMVQRVLSENVETGRRVIRALAEAGLPTCTDACRSAAAMSITTHAEGITNDVRERLRVILDETSTS